MKYIVRRPHWAILFLAAGLVAGAHAGSAAATTGSKPAVTKKNKGGSGQVKFLPGSGETSKERSGRLRRECQGGVNAGACAGYTR
ncbi:MAG: hypothetical protein JWR74_1293 [Polaromonas sp.]|nr:hypothetical protein [Polaromonas sp.]